MENKNGTDVYAGSGIEKQAKWFHIMAIISIVLSVIGIIAGVVLILWLTKVSLSAPNCLQLFYFAYRIFRNSLRVCLVLR